MSNNYLHRLERELAFLRRSKGTIYAYRRVAKRYLEFTRDNPKFTRSELVDFLDSHGKISSTYASWVLLVTKRLYDANEKPWPLLKGEGPRPEIRPQPFVTTNEVGKILALAKKESKRDFALFQVLIDTGMRRDELSKLDRKDYNGTTLLVNLSKREGYRTISLNAATVDALNDYLKSRRDRNEALFLDNRGKARMSPQLVTGVVKGYFKVIKTDQLGKGAHALRRGVVTDLAKRGVDQLRIQKWGGWQSPEMVSRYCQLVGGELSEEIAKVGALRQNNETTK